MSIASGLIKSLAKIPIKSTGRGTEALTQTFNKLNDNFFVAPGGVKNATFRSNDGFIKENLKTYSETLGQIRSQMDNGDSAASINSEDYVNWVRSKQNLKISQVNADLDSGGYLQSGALKTNLSETSFKGEVDNLNKKINGGLSSDSLGVKTINAIKGAVSKDKALGLAGDSSIKKGLDEMLETGSFESFDEPLGIKQGIEWINKNKDSDTFFEKLSFDGAGTDDGYIQRIGKRFSHTSKDGAAVGEMSGRYGELFDNGLSGAGVKLTPHEKSLLGLGASEREIRHLLDDVITPAIKKNPEFARSTYREGMTIQQFKEKLERMLDITQERVSQQVDLNDVAGRVKNSDGKSIKEVKDKFRVTDDGASDELIHFWNSPDIRAVASSLFDEDFFNRVPPKGITDMDRERFVTALTIAAYTDKALTGKILTIPQLAEKYSRSFPQFFDMLDNADMVKHVDFVIGDQFGKKLGYRDFVEDFLDTRMFTVFDDADAKKLLVNDFSLPKKVEEGVLNKIGEQDKTFTFSEYGNVKPRNAEINLGTRSFLEINEGRGANAAGESSKLATEAELILNKKTRLDNFMSGTAGKVDAIFRQFYKNPSDVGVIRDLKRFTNQINLMGSELDRMNTSMFFKKTFASEHIGAHRTGVLSGVNKRSQEVFSFVHEVVKKNDAKLKEIGWYQDGAESQVGTGVRRSMDKAIAKGEYDSVEKVLRKHFTDTNDRAATIKKTLEEIDPKGNNNAKYMAIVNDLMFPAKALSRKLANQAHAIATAELARHLKSSNQVAFTKKVGYSKLTNGEVNLKFMEDVFGTKNIYINSADAEDARKLLKDYTLQYHQSAKDIAFEINDFAARTVRHNLLMFPSTWVMVEGGNLMMYSSALNINPVQSLRMRKNAVRHFKEFSPRYQEFVKSGIAGNESFLSSLAKKNKTRTGGEVEKSFLERGNIFNPDSDAGAVSLYHLVEKPDHYFRFSVWDSMEKAGKSTDEILDIINKTVGTPDTVPDIVKKFSNMPGGDLFAAYTYTMAVNMIRIMNNNPKAFMKTVVALAAAQQASLYLFLNEKERENLKNGKEWMKPSLVNSIKLDPSIATPGGQYLVNTYFSPFSLETPSWEDSMTPTSIIIKGVLSGASPEKVLTDVSKMNRKLQQASSKLADGDLLGASASSAGFFIRDLGAN